MCEADGYNTVEAARYEGLTTEALVGRVFSGRYRVEALVGEGGMGSVYSATQLSVNRSVALKILRPEYASNLEQVRRFQTEARAASSLDHPHTIRVIDFGQSDDGALYLVTELLEGETLSDLIAREGALDPWRAARITCQVLKSLSEAHSMGIVHRDLKPENIFLTRVHGEGDFAKVLDFGIAKITAPDRERRSLTVTGTVVGTPLYMAPEQARGQAVGRSADLYSVGVLLYEMLAGEPPFMGETAMQVMMEHIQTEPPPLALSLDAPSLGELERVVDWCLAKEPADRPATADALRVLIEGFLGESVSQSAIDPRRATPPSHRAAAGDDALAPTVGVESAEEALLKPRTGELTAPENPSLTREALAVGGLRRRDATLNFATFLAVVGLAVVVGALIFYLSGGPAPSPSDPPTKAGTETVRQAPGTTAPAVSRRPAELGPNRIQRAPLVGALPLPAATASAPTPTPTPVPVSDPLPTRVRKPNVKWRSNGHGTKAPAARLRVIKK